METGIIQTGIRMDKSLYERLKRNAKQQKRSLNNYIVNILDEMTTPVMPKLSKKKFYIDDDIQKLGDVFQNLSETDIETNPRIKYILSK